MFVCVTVTADKGVVMICVWAVSNNGGRQKYTVKVDHSALPDAIIAEAIRKRTKTMKMTEVINRYLFMSLCVCKCL